MKVSVAAIKAFIGFGIIIGTVACGENGSGFGPTSPSALADPSSAQSSTTGWSTRDESRVPAIRVPAGISCPSDAPNVMMFATEVRLDIEWSFIPMVSGYEVVIERQSVTNVWEPVHTAKVNGTRYEWRGMESSRYRAKVRSIRCGEPGLWSSYTYLSLNGPPPDAIPEEPSVEEPECHYTDYSARGSSRAQTVMNCEEEDDEEPNCEYENYSTRSSTRTQTSMPCGEEEEPHCDEYSDYSARDSSRKQTTMPCGFSWGDERVRQKTRR